MIKEQEMMQKLRYRTFRRCWNNIIQRCTNPKNPGYKTYGAKGIKVSPEWQNSFPQFYEDMYDEWEPGLEIDRVDTYGDYCKENCTWVTKHENVTKRRRGAPRKSRAGTRSSVHMATYVTPEESKFFTIEAKRLGLTVSSLLREAVKTYIKEH